MGPATGQYEKLANEGFRRLGLKDPGYIFAAKTGG